MKHRWIAFYSQSGSELVNLKGKYDLVPNIIITNRESNEPLSADIISLLRNGETTLIRIPKNPKLNDYINLIKDLEISDADIISLHGYLRILPEEMCVFNILNLHPGLITKYPELKGKDPQVRAFNSRHKTIGCVIHKVISEVDSGSIVSVGEIDHEMTEKKTLTALSEKALIMWSHTLKNILYESSVLRK